MTRITQRGERFDESNNVDGEWLTVHNMQLKMCCMKMSEKMTLFHMQELNDRIINASPKKICIISFHLCRACIQLLNIGFWTGNYLQILHCRSSHWITVSSNLVSSRCTIHYLMTLMMVLNGRWRKPLHPKLISFPARSRHLTRAGA